MNLAEVIERLGLTVLTEEKNFSSIIPIGGYTSDLLSCVMAGATQGCIWVTLQAHSNIIAVASLDEVSAVIITEGAMPDPGTISRANQEGVVLLSTAEQSYPVIGKLWELGIKA